VKAIIDTNCLLASISPKGAHYWLYEAFSEEKFTWILSNEILLEYEEQLSIFFSKKTADLVLSILSIAPNTAFIDPFYQWRLIEQDKDDNKFVDCYLASNANALVTQDKHFEILKSIDFPEVNVVSLHEFKELLTTIR
jgi:putative PIN family toxin of toxin-antitoxin system